MDKQSPIITLQDKTTGTKILKIEVLQKENEQNGPDILSHQDAQNLSILSTLCQALGKTYQFENERYTIIGREKNANSIKKALYIYNDQEIGERPSLVVHMQFTKDVRSKIIKIEDSSHGLTYLIHTPGKNWCDKKLTGWIKVDESSIDVLNENLHKGMEDRHSKLPPPKPAEKKRKLNNTKERRVSKFEEEQCRLKYDKEWEMKLQNALELQNKNWQDKLTAAAVEAKESSCREIQFLKDEVARYKKKKEVNQDKKNPFFSFCQLATSHFMLPEPIYGKDENEMLDRACYFLGLKRDLALPDLFGVLASKKGQYQRIFHPDKALKTTQDNPDLVKQIEKDLGESYETVCNKLSCCYNQALDLVTNFIIARTLRQCFEKKLKKDKVKLTTLFFKKESLLQFLLTDLQEEDRASVNRGIEHTFPSIWEEFFWQNENILKPSLTKIVNEEWEKLVEKPETFAITFEDKKLQIQTLLESLRKNILFSTWTDPDRAEGSKDLFKTVCEETISAWEKNTEQYSTVQVIYIE